MNRADYKCSKLLRINKSDMSEILVRKTLYWIDEKYSWELLEFDNYWEIELTGCEKYLSKEFSKLNSRVNDNILRYKLSRDSYTTRELIIKKALAKLANDG